MFQSIILMFQNRNNASFVYKLQMHKNKNGSSPKLWVAMPESQIIFVHHKVHKDKAQRSP